LVDAKKIEPTYLQNDTHWNSYGAFVAARTLLNAMSEQLSDPLSLDLGDFAWTNAPSPPGTNFDMSRMLGINPTEQNYYIFTPGPSLPALRRHEDMNYSTAWGSKRVLAIENPLSNSPSAVFFVDSFGNRWEPFLGYSFKTTTFLEDNRMFDARLITNSHPAIVVNEILERYFNTEDTQRMMAKDGLP